MSQSPINYELEVMKNLIDWCISKGFENKRIIKLIYDWHKASGEIIPKEEFENELKRRFYDTFTTTMR